MRHHTVRLQSRGRPLNNRGVAFLFQAYLITFWFVVLIGAMMMRSSQELQAVRLGIETQQALWIAEMGTDEMLYGLKVNPPTLSANQCTVPLLRLIAQPVVTTDFLGSDPFSTGTLNTATVQGYTAQVCLKQGGEYQLVSVGMNNTRVATLLTTVADVPTNNLQFNQALLAPQTVVVKKAVLSSVDDPLNLVQNGVFQAPSADSPVLGAHAHIGTFAEGTPVSIPGSHDVSDDVNPVAID